MTTWFAGDASCEIMMPSVQLTDFNRDGYVDLQIVVSTNMNGNQWVKLFLYNPVTQKVERLENDAKGEAIWDAPEFNVKAALYVVKEWLVIGDYLLKANTN